MKSILTVIIAILFASQFNAQISVHEEQLNHYNSLGNADAAHYEKTTTAAPKLGRQKGNCNLDQVVYGWHPYWVGNAYQNYDFDLLSHFSFFSYEVNSSTGESNNSHGWSTSAAVDAALASGNTKVTLCVTLFSGHSTFFGSASAQQTLIDNLISMVSSRGAHGVQIDFEGLPNSQKTNFANWMVTLSQQMKAAIAGAEVSTVLYAVDWNDVFDFSIMNAHVDHFIIMGYAYYYQGSSNTGPCDPLYQFGNSYNFTLSSSISYYIDKGCPRNKLVMGLPYYGYEWSTASTSVPDATTASGNARTFAVVKNNTSGNYSPANYQWDADSYTDIFAFNNAGTPKQCFIALEDAIEKRFDHIRKSNIAGMGVWALGYDDGYNEIWDLIDEYMTDCYESPCNGTIHDFGGPTKDYYDDEDYTWTIEPPGATSIDVTFSEFDVEAGFDYLYIYDGNSVGAAQIAGSPFSGTTLPSSFTSTTNAVTFRFTSDGATNNAGFLATYTCNQDDIAPTTAIEPGTDWQTTNFDVDFTDADDVNGTGLNTSFWSVASSGGGEFRGTGSHGFVKDQFDGALHSDWSSVTGAWAINTGKLEQSDETLSNTDLSIDVSQTAGNTYLYHWKGEINGSGTNRRAGLHFMCDDAMLTNRGNSYLVYWRTDSDKCQIYKCSANSIDLQTDDAVTVNPNQEYDFKIYFNQSTGEIKAYLDDVLVSSWTDATPHTTGNSISLRAGNANMIVDDLVTYVSRTSTETVAIGSATDMVAYQNPSPNISSALVSSIVLDNANNFSSLELEYFDVDWTVPVTPASAIDGIGMDIDTFTVNTEISGNYNIFNDVHSGVMEYYVGVGTSPGSDNIIGFASNGTNTSYTKTGLSLTYNMDYFISVYAVNNAGLTSATIYSDGQYLKEPFLSPDAGFTIASTVVCLGDSIQINNTTANAASYAWSTSGGSVNLSSTTVSNPYIIVNGSGSATVTLQATGPGGSDTDAQTFNFNVVNPPVAGISPNATTVTLPLAVVNFTNTSSNANGYTWYFGDGSTSTDINPFYNYNAAGVYTVELIAENGICPADTTNVEITVQHAVGIDEAINLEIKLSPNPFNNQISVSGFKDSFTYRLISATGQLVASGNSNRIINLEDVIAPGIYVIELSSEGKNYLQKIIKK